MRTSQKLILIVAGLSLGACSSMEGENDNTDVIYEELKSDILSYDEVQPLTTQTNIDGINSLEVDVSELTRNTSIDSMSSETSPADAAPIDTMSFETSSVNAAPIDTMSFETSPVGAAPIDIMSFETSPVDAAPIDTMSFDTSPVNATPIETMFFDTATIDAMIADGNTAVIEPEPNPIITSATTTYGVQVASYSNREAVIRNWNALLKKDPVSFSGLQPLVNQKEVQGRIMHQLKVGPFLNKSFSDDFCKKLKGKGTDCFVTQYSGDVFTAN